MYIILQRPPDPLLTSTVTKTKRKVTIYSMTTPVATAIMAIITTPMIPSSSAVAIANPPEIISPNPDPIDHRSLDSRRIQRKTYLMMKLNSHHLLYFSPFLLFLLFAFPSLPSPSPSPSQSPNPHPSAPHPRLGSDYEWEPD